MKKDVLSLVETSILVAIAIAFDFLSKLIPGNSMPQGGSVSIVLLPLVIIAYRHGFIHGFIGGFIYGFYNFLMDGYAFHWGSFIFDYGLAFILVGMAAIFKKDALKGNILNFVLGLLLASFLKYLMSSLSGVLFFSEYAGDLNPWFYSFIIYNLPYNALSLLFILMMGVVIYPSLVKVLNPEEQMSLEH